MRYLNSRLERRLRADGWTVAKAQRSPSQRGCNRTWKHPDWNNGSSVPQKMALRMMFFVDLVALSRELT